VPHYPARHAWLEPGSGSTPARSGSTLAVHVGEGRGGEGGGGQYGARFGGVGSKGEERGEVGDAAAVRREAERAAGVMGGG
jgi:hypothetical protein